MKSMCTVIYNAIVLQANKALLFNIKKYYKTIILRIQGNLVVTSKDSNHDYNESGNNMWIGENNEETIDSDREDGIKEEKQICGDINNRIICSACKEDAEVRFILIFSLL